MKRRRGRRRRGSDAVFVVGDALKLEGLNQKFDTATDSGLFHVFPDDGAYPYAKSLHSVLNHGGTYFMLCFSEEEPADWGGPRRVSQEEIRATFSDGWKVNSIRAARFETTFHKEGGRPGSPPSPPYRKP